MANYCMKCGAYIPDGQTKCLACGYDASEMTRAQTATASGRASYAEAGTASRGRSTSAGAAAPQTAPGGGNKRNEAAWREQAERKRAQQQEWERKWAENEQRRREMEEQFRNRERGTGAVNGEYSFGKGGGQGMRTSSRTGKTAPQSGRRNSNGTSRTVVETCEKSRRFAAISYLSILCVVPYFLCPEDEFAMYHAKQGLALLLFSLAAEILGSLLGAGWVVTLLRIGLIIKGFRTARAGRKEPLPVIGNYVKY